VPVIISGSCNRQYNHPTLNRLIPRSQYWVSCVR